MDRTRTYSKLDDALYQAIVIRGDEEIARRVAEVLGVAWPIPTLQEEFDAQEEGP